MQQTSALYKSILAGEHECEMKVVINNVEYSEDYIVSCSTSLETLNTSDALPSLGNTVSAQIDLKLIGFDFTVIPKMAEIKVYYRIKNTTQTSEWIQKGVYFIDTRSENQDGVLEIHGYDPMLKADLATIEADGEQGNWPKTDIQTVQYIANRIQVSVDSRTNAIMTQGYTVEYPGYGDDGYSMRQVLSFIGAMYGGYFIISDTGTLLLRQIKTTESTPVLTIGECDSYKLYSQSSPYCGIEGSTGLITVTSQVAVSDTVSSSAPYMVVKGTATVARKSITAKDISASVQLQFLIGSDTSYTENRWNAQLAWSNLENNKSELVQLNEYGTHWDHDTVQVLKTSVEGQEWCTEGYRTLHIYVYRDRIPLWEASTRYTKNTVCKYNNYYFRCKTTHTSTDVWDSDKWVQVQYSTALSTVTLAKKIDVRFDADKMPRYDATANDTGGALIYTKSEIPKWEVNKSYALHDVVINSGSIYECTTAHISTTTFDSSKWEKKETKLVMNFECPWATQEMIDNLYDQVYDYIYQPYEFEETVCDPAIEIGDYITLGDTGKHSYAFNIRTDFGPIISMDIEAPNDSEISSEYQKEKKTNTRKALENLVNQLKTSFTVQEGLIQSIISGTIVTYSQATDPSIDNQMNVGDLWYDTTNESWKRWNGTGWEATVSREPQKWEPQHLYHALDLVSYQGQWYKCKLEHTSTSNFDPTKWEQVSRTDAQVQSMIQQEIDKITLSVSLNVDDTTQESSVTITYNGIEIKSNIVDIIGKLELWGNVWYNGLTTEGDEFTNFLIGVNNNERLQIGSASDTSGVYDSTSFYGGGPIYFMADANDSGISGADAIISNAGIRVPAMASSADNDEYIVSIASNGQLHVSSKQVKDAGGGSGIAVFG